MSMHLGFLQIVSLLPGKHSCTDCGKGTDYHTDADEIWASRSLGIIMHKSCVFRHVSTGLTDVKPFSKEFEWQMKDFVSIME